MEDFSKKEPQGHPVYRPRNLQNVQVSQADIEGIVEEMGLNPDNDGEIITVETAKQALEKAKANIAEHYHVKSYGNRSGGSSSHMNFGDNFEV